jgi:hypothetical protein
VVSVSTDAGASFTGTATPVEQLPSISDERPGGPFADQWWQWAALNPETGRVTTAYYDRKYGDAQQTGFMDITLRRGDGSHMRVTNRSLPPTQEFPEAGASSGVFLGDYMGVAVGSDGVAHPVWTDTPATPPDPVGDVSPNHYVEMDPDPVHHRQLRRPGWDLLQPRGPLHRPEPHRQRLPL